MSDRSQEDRSFIMTSTDETSSTEPTGRGMLWVVAQIPLLLLAILLPVVQHRTGRQRQWPTRIAPLARALGLLGLGVSVVIFWDASRVLGKGLVPYPRPPEGAVLRTTGVYARACHPIYLGIIVAVASWGLLWNSVTGLVASIPCTVFFWLKSRYEERYLEAR